MSILEQISNNKDIKRPLLRKLHVRINRDAYLEFTVPLVDITSASKQNELPSKTESDAPNHHGQ